MKPSRTFAQWYSPFDRELGTEGHEILSRPRQQVPFQHLTELRDHASAVRQQIIGPVQPGRAFHDLPGQGTRLCGAWREARHSGETGRGNKVMLQDELATQLLPRFSVVRPASGEWCAVSTSAVRLV
ncbi:hypothetical protein [Streptomyces sp. NPDC005262]|uniref:hypothetical protein n=1 Tax=Streptomyces sp. NPDC005262 TaxID=3364710 RepID=UPI0036B41109